MVIFLNENIKMWTTFDKIFFNVSDEALIDPSTSVPFSQDSGWLQKFNSNVMCTDVEK